MFLSRTATLVADCVQEMFRTGKLHPAIFRCHFCGHNKIFFKKWVIGEFQMLLVSLLFILIYTYIVNNVSHQSHTVDRQDKAE